MQSITAYKHVATYTSAVVISFSVVVVSEMCRWSIM